MPAAFSAWTHACPLTATCPECGLTFDWADLLNPSRQRIPWLYEHANHWWDIRRAWGTCFRALAPWWFWKRASLRTGSTRLRTLLHPIIMVGTVLMALVAFGAAYQLLVRSGLMWSVHWQDPRPTWSSFTWSGFGRVLWLGACGPLCGPVSFWMPVRSYVFPGIFHGPPSALLNGLPIVFAMAAALSVLIAPRAFGISRLPVRVIARMTNGLLAPMWVLFTFQLVWNCARQVAYCVMPQMGLAQALSSSNEFYEDLFFREYADVLWLACFLVQAISLGCALSYSSSKRHSLKTWTAVGVLALVSVCVARAASGPLSHISVRLWD